MKEIESSKKMIIMFEESVTFLLLINKDICEVSLTQTFTKIKIICQ